MSEEDRKRAHEAEVTRWTDGVDDDVYSEEDLEYMGWLFPQR